MSAPLTVGDFRREMEGLPDEAQVFVATRPGPDLGVWYVVPSRQIPWSHDCTDADDEHQPGRDCPTVIGFEINARDIAEIEAEQAP